MIIWYRISGQNWTHIKITQVCGIFIYISICVNTKLWTHWNVIIILGVLHNSFWIFSVSWHCTSLTFFTSPVMNPFPVRPIRSEYREMGQGSTFMVEWDSFAIESERIFQVLDWREHCRAPVLQPLELSHLSDEVRNSMYVDIHLYIRFLLDTRALLTRQHCTKTRGLLAPIRLQRDFEVFLRRLYSYKLQTLCKEWNVSECDENCEHCWQHGWGKSSHLFEYFFQ